MVHSSHFLYGYSEDGSRDIDLSNACLYVKVNPAFPRFLHCECKGQFFLLNVMLYGLCSTLCLFTKLESNFCFLVMGLLQSLGYFIRLDKSDLAHSKSFMFMGLCALLCCIFHLTVILIISGNVCHH